MCEDGNCSEEPKAKGPNAVRIILCMVAMGLAVASSALMATASQCTIVQFGFPSHTVTYSDFRPFVYLVIVNAIAAFVVAIAIFLSTWKKGKDGKAKVLLPLLAAAAPAMLYSSTGAAFAAGEMTYCSAHGRQASVCSSAATGNNFCNQVRLAMYLSLAAALSVSAAEMVKNLRMSKCSCSCGSDSDSSSSSESGCGHGCHSKH